MSKLGVILNKYAIAVSIAPDQIEVAKAKTEQQINDWLAEVIGRDSTEAEIQAASLERADRMQTVNIVKQEMRRKAGL